VLGFLLVVYSLKWFSMEIRLFAKYFNYAMSIIVSTSAVFVL